MGFDTAANIINAAGKELGLFTSTVADPFASTDPNVLQLCSLLDALGRKLLREHDWSQLRKEQTFTVANGTTSYSLPADFFRYIEQSGWNRTQDQPLEGPLTAQQWQQLQAVSSSATVTNYFRLMANLFYLWPTPSNDTDSVAYEYASTYWVKENGQASPNTETCDASTDTLHFDRQLLVTGLKLAFKRAKGFDSTAEQGDYDDALSMALGAHGSAPILSVARPRPAFRFLDRSNLPETNYGS